MFIGGLARPRQFFGILASQEQRPATNHQGSIGEFLQFSKSRRGVQQQGNVVGVLKICVSVDARAPVAGTQIVAGNKLLDAERLDSLLRQGTQGKCTHASNA